jgi:hypothetical protein
MRVLSTKLPMVDAFDEKVFYGVIVNWLKNAGPCKTIGINFEAYEDKSKACLEDTYCKLETFVSEKDNCLYYLFKLEQVFHEQTWTTEVILRNEDDSRTVFFHIDCSKDATQFDEAPDIRTDVIRCFINSGFIKQPRVKITPNPIPVTDDLERWVAMAAREEYEEDMPIVLATQFFDSMSFAVDEYSLAKKLAGVAYVLTSDSEATRGIKAKAGRKTPFNGTVAIYTSKGKTKIYRQEDAYYGTSLDKQILTEVQRIVTAKVDADAPTWKSLHNEMLKAEAEEKSMLLDEAFDENISLEEQVKRLSSKVLELTEENRVLRSKNETLELALQNGSSDGILTKAPIEEFYEGEQYDLLVRIINESLLKRNHEYRDFEILQQLAVVNKEKGLGREIFKVVKAVLSDGHAPRESDLARLRSVGFEVVSQSNHYKLKFRGSENYWFSLAKPPSDYRAGQNLVSDITKTLSVYK